MKSFSYKHLFNREQKCLKCLYCGEDLTTHRRCKKCRILLHKKNDNYKCGCGIQHNEEGVYNKTICKYCEQRKKKK